MPDIVFHIGYPKTATTYLQNTVWPANFACAGKQATSPSAHAAGRRFVRLYHGAGSGVWSRSEGQEVVRRLAAEAGDGPLVVSNEELLKASVFLQPRRFRVFWRDGRFAAPDHLAAFAQDGWVGLGRVRVLVAVRRQVEWLGSSYAQHSDRLPAGQADFETRLRRYLARGDAGPLGYLDYGTLIAELQARLGAENVSVLPYEDLKAGTAGEVLQAAFPEGIHLPEKPGGGGNRRGAETAGGGKAWRLRGPRGGGLRARWRQARRRGREPGTITLPEDLQAEVMAHFAPRNRRLGELIGRSDLQRYGYW